MSNTTITVNRGAGYFEVSQQPAVLVPMAAGLVMETNQNVDYAAGELDISGAAPVQSIFFTINSSGALTLSGLSGLAQLGYLWPTATGAMALSGHAPTLTLQSFDTPSSGTVALTGKTASVQGVVKLSPSGSSMGLSTLSPQQGIQASIPVATMVLVSAAPAMSLQVKFAPNIVALTFTGQQPGVVIQINTALPPSAGSAAFTFQSPVLRYGFARSPASGALVLSSSSGPGFSYSITTATGSLVLSGGPVQLSAVGFITPPAGIINLSGVQAALSPPTMVSTNAGSAALSGQQPLFGYSYLDTPSVAAVAFSGLSPQLSIVPPMFPATADASFTGSVPQFNYGTGITPSDPVISFSGLAPLQLISASSPSGDIAATGSAVVLNIKYTLAPADGLLTLSSDAQSVGAGFTIAPEAGSLAVDGAAGSATVPVLTYPQAGALLSSGGVALLTIQPPPQVTSVPITFRQFTTAMVLSLSPL